jgi:hypothetical protein
LSAGRFKIIYTPTQKPADNFSLTEFSTISTNKELRYVISLTLELMIDATRQESTHNDGLVTANNYFLF